MSKYWIDFLNDIDLTIEDIHEVITSDFKDDKGNYYLIASYYNKEGLSLFNSIPYYTIKDCLRDNEIFVNNGTFLLQYTEDFKAWTHF